MPSSRIRIADRREAGIPPSPITRLIYVGEQSEAVAHWTATGITGKLKPTPTRDMVEDSERPRKPGPKWYKLWRSSLTDKARRIAISRKIRAYNKAMKKWRAENAPKDDPALVAKLDKRAFEVVRTFYRWHVVNNGWTDIGYHRIVFAHGLIVLGRAAGRQGAHAGTTVGNRKLGVAFVMGPGDIGSPEMVEAANYIETKDSVTIKYGHKDFIPTACPGPWVEAHIVRPARQPGYKRGSRKPFAA